MLLWRDGRGGVIGNAHYCGQPVLVYELMAEIGGRAGRTLLRKKFGRTVPREQCSPIG